MTTFVEVGPEAGGGWVVTVFTEPADVLHHSRTKRAALLIGTGAAKALRCELKVKNRKGQYTTQAASYGPDPRRSRG